MESQSVRRRREEQKRKLEIRMLCKFNCKNARTHTLTGAAERTKENVIPNKFKFFFSSFLVGAMCECGCICISLPLFRLTLSFISIRLPNSFCIWKIMPHSKAGCSSNGSISRYIYSFERTQMMERRPFWERNWSLQFSSGITLLYLISSCRSLNISTTKCVLLELGTKKRFRSETWEIKVIVNIFVTDIVSDF